MISDKGYHRPTYNEILAVKIQTAKELFGEDIDTGEQTALGKFIRIGAYDLAKAYEELELVYYARFPNTAIGVSLDRLCVFAAISRNPATRSQHIITVYGEAGFEFGIGELEVCGENGDITFYNVNNYTISENGSVEVVVECTEAGEIGNVTKITEIVNPIAEIERIEYIGSAKIGEEVESDYDLRKRFSETLSGAGSSNANAIRAAILRVPTVKSASVIENKTGEVDAQGRPANSFECYAYGGEEYEQEIAEAIFEKAPAGIQTCSTSSNPVIKTVTDDSGTEHTIKFSHTENVNVYIKIKYKKNANFETDGEKQIENILIENINGLGVGEPVIYSSLYGKIYSVAGVVDVTELSISTNGNSYTQSNIPISQWQVAQTDAAKIVLEVVE